MSQYKVPQNVEAEDHILGPLTFKQFIYACIGVGWAIACFAIFRVVPALMFVLGFPPTLLFLLLAFYTRDGQNFEQILLAMVGFFAAARRRLWVKEAVAVTFHVEPAQIAHEISQRDPTEVRSQLEKLATLIDSRGWNQPARPETEHFLPATARDDRIVAPPPATPPPDEPQTDMLALNNSPLAQNLAQLLAEANPGAGASGESVSGVTPAGHNDILKTSPRHQTVDTKKHGS